MKITVTIEREAYKKLKKISPKLGQTIEEINGKNFDLTSTSGILDILNINIFGINIPKPIIIRRKKTLKDILK